MAGEEIEADHAAAPEAAATSRLCVKNIPKHVNEAKLKEYFSSRGEVTDVKVLRTKDGHSRQMGFVGFKTAQQAAAAQKYYNRAYMDALQLTVEFAYKVGDQQLPRPWSKHSQGSSAGKKQASAGDEQATEADGKGKKAGKAGKERAHSASPVPDDPKLKEFLALMQPRNKAKIWANDEGQMQADQQKQAQQLAQQQQQQHTGHHQGGKGRRGPAGAWSSDEEGDEEYQDLTRVVARAHRAGSGSGDDSDGDARMADVGEDDDGGEEQGGAAAAGKDQVVLDEGVSDLDYLRARMKRWDDSDGGDEDMDDAAGEDGAAARGDQSGVGPSPRSGAAAAGGKQGKEAKAKGQQQQQRAKPGSKARGGSGGDAEPVQAADGEYSDPGRGSEDLGDEDDQDPGSRNQGPAAGAKQKQHQHEGGGGGGNGAGGDGNDGDDELRDSGRLFLRNLAYTATEDDISDAFGAYGDLQEVHLVLDRETKRSKGIAYVQFRIPEDAVKAARDLDGSIFQGRLLHILPAKRQPLGDKHADPSAAAADGANGGGGADGTTNFKAQREAQRKADAGNRAAWNTLFMRSDTVAEAIAAHYGLSKAALLDASAAAPARGGDHESGAAVRAPDSVAVRMALGEAHVIATTKQALADAGVNVDALEAAAAASGKASATKSVARSPTALMVKNLPYSAQEDELMELFGRSGPLARLVLPPTRVLALVEYTEPQDARSAFRALAYKKYQHVPLYLEWAPADIFNAPAAQQQQQHARPGAAQQQQPAAKGGKAAAGAAAAAGGMAVEEEAGAAGGAATPAADAAAADASSAPSAVTSTIFVKNLAFASTDEGLRKHFERVTSAAGSRLHSARVARKKEDEVAAGKKGKKKKGKQAAAGQQGGLSLGYGFVEVDSEEVATAIIKQLQGSMLDGHKLVLQLSKRRAAAGDAAAGGAARGGKGLGSSGGKKGDEGSTKLVVRNVAFEATKKDIQGLFNPFGHLKSCRLPKKFDGSHRGFAFVEFVTKQEARNAMEGVGGTHLYGRRLVVEYAKEEEGLDEVRAKAAATLKRDEEVETAAAAGAAGRPAKRVRI